MNARSGSLARTVFRDDNLGYILRINDNYYYYYYYYYY